MNRSYRSRSIRVSGRSRAGAQTRKPGVPRSAVLIAVLVLVAVAAGGVILALSGSRDKAATGSNTNPPVNADLNSDTIYEGVSVDGISLGGLTKAQAKERVEANQKEFVKNTGVTITNDKQKVVYTISELPYTFDTDAVIDEAWSQGRKGTDEERRSAIRQLAEAPVKLTTKAAVDTSPLEERVRELAEPYSVTPVDAKFVSYDATKPEGQRLVFTSDIPGSRVDADALWAAVKKEFDDGTYGTVQMQIVPVEPKIKLADLQGSMQLIGICDTYLSNHKKERYTNIRLASEAISGRILAPGEVFSFNDTTGERTAAKGYMDAPIDNQGVEDVGIGGGICQVSGTLFNAAMRSGLEMVERHHHSIPSAYLKKGRDATVDYGKYDLKIKNNKDKPVLIVMHYGTGEDKEKYTLYAEIYGPPPPAGVKGYDLEAVLTKTIPAKEGYRKVGSKALKPGEQKVIDAHAGYVIKVYTKTIMSDNTEKLSDEPLYTDTYDADMQVLVFYYQDEAPTGLPTASPSPTPNATQAPTQAPTPAPEPAATEAVQV